MNSVADAMRHAARLFTSSSQGTRALPVVHRLALLYLMLPVAIWLLGWFKWWVGWPMVGLLGLGLGPAWAGSWRGNPPGATWGLLLAALGWVMLTAAGNVFDSFNVNWADRRTILLDLGRYPWPAFLPDPLAAYFPPATNNAPPLLRYYLGWHMVPGLAARLWGPGALQWAVPLWTWSGVALVTLLFAQRRRGRRAAAAAAVLIFFSGMDFLRVLLFGGWDWSGWFDLNWERPPFFEPGDVRLWLFSHATTLAWVPQHFTAAGLYALLLWQLRRHARFLAVSGVALAAAPFWSVFAAVGLLPLGAALLWRNGLRPFLRWPNLCLAGPLAGLITLYLAAGPVDFPRGWIWERHDWTLLARWMPAFYLTEFLALALLLLGARPSLRREPFFAASLAALVLLPLYYFSAANDLLLRGSLPALMLLAYFCADVVAGPPREAGWGPRWARAGLTGALAVGALTAGFEWARSVREAHPFRYAQATLTALVDMPPRFQRENVAFAQPALLRRLLQEPGFAGAPPAASGTLIVRGELAVYWDGRRLIYKKAPCRREDATAAIFLHVTPAARADFAAAFRRAGLNAAGYGRLQTEGRMFGTACGWIWALPSLDVASIRTGQRLKPDGNWQADIVFNAEGAIARVDYQDEQDMRAAYEALASSEPTVRAPFNVYVTAEAVIYVKEACTPESTQAKFILHVIPQRRQDLPRHRRRYGFDNLAFRFDEQGVRFDDVCWARVALPAYDIARLRAGQYSTRAQRNLWLEEIAVAAPRAA